MSETEHQSSRLIGWQLDRMYQAFVSYRRRGLVTAWSARHFDNWFEAGSIWALEKPGDALEFAAFQVGVTLRETGGLPLLEKTAGSVRDEQGEDAMRWVVGIWAELYPDWEARIAFLSRFGVHD